MKIVQFNTYDFEHCFKCQNCGCEFIVKESECTIIKDYFAKCWYNCPICETACTEIDHDIRIKKL